MNTTNNDATRCTVFGNLGGNPEDRSIPAKVFTKKVYDAMIDDVVEKETTLPERNFLVFSVACGGYDDVPLRWINCVDWDGHAFRARKGDTVELYGFFEDRTYKNQAGETKTARQFVVENCWIRKMKIRDTVS